jgi:hypothetical protein
VRLTYTIRLTDLFWMWLTSWFTPATVVFGLFFGVEGWPIVISGGRPWDRLHRPRIESRVVVLPFRHGTSALGWVVIPRSALTDGQLATLVELLRARGALRRGHGRSLVGRLLSPFLDRPGAAGVRGPG